MPVQHELEFDADSFGQILGPAGLRDLMKHMFDPVAAREVVAAINQQHIARDHEGSTFSPGGNFACEATYDGFAFYDAVSEHGREGFASGDLDKDFYKRVPASRVKSRPRKASIIHPGTPWKTPQSRDGGPLIVAASR